MQNILNHVSGRSSHLTGKCRKKIKIFRHLGRGGYFAAVSYGIVHDVFVLFTFAKGAVIWFDTLSDTEV